MGVLLSLALSLALLSALQPAANAASGRCPESVELEQVFTKCTRPISEVRAIMARSGVDGYTYDLLMQCWDAADVTACDSPRACYPEGGGVGIWHRLMRRPIGGGQWEYWGDVCLSGKDMRDFGILTPERVFKEMQELEWPTAELVVQPPGGRTLVNFRTNFYTELVEPEIQTVRILGLQVEIEATPITFTWHWGDGNSTERTDWPGDEVPVDVSESDLDKLITHEYVSAGVTVSPSVDVTYQGRFRLDDTDWIPIPDTLTLTGDPAALEVIEARVQLVG